MGWIPTRNHRRRTAALLMVAVFALSPLLAAPPARAATTFVVNRVGDQADPKLGDNVCDVDVATGVQCTLRAAIQQANATDGVDTIHFNVPGPGVHTIQPASPLPAITGPVTIDGYTQPGSSPNTAAAGTDAKLRIELDGTIVSGGSGTGLKVGLLIQARNTVVKGLVAFPGPIGG